MKALLQVIKKNQEKIPLQLLSSVKIEICSALNLEKALVYGLIMDIQLTLFDMEGDMMPSPNMFSTTVLKCLGGGS